MNINRKVTNELYHQSNSNNMNKKRNLLKYLFLFFLCFLLTNSCNYKGPDFFSPTTSIPGEEPSLMVPQLVYPPNGSSDIGRRLSFEWQMVDHATAYDLQIAKEGESFENANSFSQSGLSSNMYPVEGLEYQTYYKWRVRATADDIFSEWSPVWGFTTIMEPVTTHTLNVQTEGNGTVTSNDSKINCGDDCSEDYEEGTEVTLTAEAAEGWIFDGWTGDVPDNCDSENCSITLDSDKTVTATFVEEEEPSSLYFPDPLICIQHSQTQSAILWLWSYNEMIGNEFEVTMQIILPNGNVAEVEVTSASDAVSLLFFLDIFTYGNYQWQITKVVNVNTGEQIGYDGTTEGVVEVGANEQNPDQCN